VTGRRQGADEYIVTLLSNPTHPDRVYAGGPYRSRFARFQRLSRVKRIGWSREIRRLRRVYAQGLAELDLRMAGGDFAGAPAPTQDAILTELDYAGSAFFNAPYNHTLEGVYSHRSTAATVTTGPGTPSATRGTCTACASSPGSARRMPPGTCTGATRRRR
jgi:hypothetical protein